MALALANQIRKSTNDERIPLNKCREQRYDDEQKYDGVNNLKGTHCGVQKFIIKVIEPNAVYCAAHNLNLKENDAVKD